MSSREDFRERLAAVPTDDDAVRRRLREKGLPAELPGETREARRLRLAEAGPEVEADVEPEEPAKDWDEAASPQLVGARRRIAETARNPQSSNVELEKLDLYASQAGFARPVAAVRLFGDRLCVGDYAGTLSVLDTAEDLAVAASAQGTGRVGDIAAHADFVASGDLANVNLYSWDLRHLGVLRGHASAVTALDIHHTGDYIVSSGDSTWRLWDRQTLDSLLVQDGHTGEVNCAKISADGCMVGTAGADHDVRVWDLRNGLPVTTLQNHPCAVRTLAWDPNSSWTLASAGDDNRCLVWDLRQAARPLHTLYAHTSTVTGAVFAGGTLITSSLDETVKLWRDGELRRVHRTGCRMLCVDAGRQIAAGRWDRQVDLYAQF